MHSLGRKMTREANSSLPLKETQRVRTLRSPWILESQGNSVFDNAALVWRGYLWNCITFNLNQRVWSLLNAWILLCLPLCNPMDRSPPGSSVHGIFQAKTRSGLPFSSSWESPHPGIKHLPPASPTLAGRLSATESPGKPHGRHWILILKVQLDHGPEEKWKRCYLQLWVLPRRKWVMRQAFLWGERSVI